MNSNLLIILAITLSMCVACGKRSDATKRGDAADPVPVLTSGTSSLEWCRDPSKLSLEAEEIVRKFDPLGAKILEAVGSKAFDQFLTCSSNTFEIDAAIHESIHIIDGAGAVDYPYVNKYFLTQDNQIELPKPLSSVYRFKVSPGSFTNSDYFFDEDDKTANTYLHHGGAGQSFFVLLDEMNAETHGTRTAVAIYPHVAKEISSAGGGKVVAGSINHRDLLLFYMSAVKGYLHQLQRYDPEGLVYIQQRPVSKIVKALWSEAEGALNDACAVPSFGIEDAKYAAILYGPVNGEELSLVIGRKPEMPIACRNLGWP